MELSYCAMKPISVCYDRIGTEQHTTSSNYNWNEKYNNGIVCVCVRMYGRDLIASVFYMAFVQSESRHNWFLLVSIIFQQLRLLGTDSNSQLWSHYIVARRPSILDCANRVLTSFPPSTKCYCYMALYLEKNVNRSLSIMDGNYIVENVSTISYKWIVKVWYLLNCCPNAIDFVVNDKALVLSYVPLCPIEWNVNIFIEDFRYEHRYIQFWINDPIHCYSIFYYGICFSIDQF